MEKGTDEPAVLITAHRPDPSVEGRLAVVERKVDELPRALAEVVQAEFAKRDGRSG